MPPMRRKRSDPLFMGQPSPSLAKMSKMTIDQLNERVKSLELEASRISEKIKNLSNMQPRDEARIALLTSQRERLAALQQVAKDRLAGKPLPIQPREPRDRGNIRTFRRDPGGPGSFGGSRPFGGGRFPRR